LLTLILVSLIYFDSCFSLPRFQVLESQIAFVINFQLNNLKNDFDRLNQQCLSFQFYT
jgi:hypothetical protein